MPDPIPIRADEHAATHGGPSEEFLDETIRFWQPRLGQQLTREDARQIVQNMTGFFRVLAEWDRSARAGRSDERAA